MNQVFLDSSYFKALIDEFDDFHKIAFLIFSELNEHKSELITTNYIVDETLTLLRVKKNLDAAILLRDLIRAGSPIITIYRITPEDDADAWSWFTNSWSRLSFTDCTSFAVMKRLGLTHVATFDKHFSLAGFTIVSEKS